jgi:hypothetical protein
MFTFVAKASPFTNNQSRGRKWTNPLIFLILVL